MYSLGIACTILAADDRIVAVRVGIALVTTSSGDARWADARTGIGIAECSRRAIARSAVGKTEIARLTTTASAANDTRFARALTSKFVAFETQRTFKVALARQGTAVEFCGQSKYGLAAEIVW